MGRFRYFRYALILGALIYLTISIVVFPAFVNHTSFCGWCHAPRIAYQTATESTHKNLGCLQCHRYPGFGGFLATDAAGIRNLGLTIRGGLVGSGLRDERRVDNNTCLACHDKVLYGLSRTKTVKMSHREVIDSGWRCVDCHGEAGHIIDRANKGQLQTASMDKCLDCHLSEPRLSRCGLCHIDQKIADKTPDNPTKSGILAHAGTWGGKKHAVPDAQTCRMCHEKAFCKTCHGVELPHSEDSWPATHGATAKQNADSCQACHGQNFCVSCHGIEMPHPPNYYQNHLNGVENKQDCVKCHSAFECLACHETHQKHKSRIKRFAK
jgi:hypothetical protein